MKIKINNINSIIAVIGFALILQSCFVAKKYEEPKTNLELNNLFRTDQQLDSNTLAATSWQELLKDSILQNYIDTALKNNYDSRIAIENISKAASNLKQGKSAFAPSLSAGATWSHQRFSKNSQFGALFDGTLDQFELAGKLNWEIDVWGKIRSQKKAIESKYFQSIANHQALETQIITNIAKFYFQLQAMDAQKKVLEKTIANRIQSLEIIKDLKESGLVNEVAVKQTEAQQYTAQLILEDLKYNIKVIENTLSILLGKEPQNIVREDFSNQNITANISLGYPVLMLGNRPDVVAAELNFRNAFELTNVARSDFYPSLTISASTGLQSLELKDWFDYKSIFASILTGLAQPIFNQRKIKTNYENAKSNQEIARLQYEQKLLEAGKEVSNALANLENESTKYGILKNKLTALQDAAAYSDELLEFGFVNYLEVLTAKDNALSTELDLINNQLNQLNAVLDLYQALGGGN